MNQRSADEHPLAVSYFGLRRTIGFIGFFLPLVLSLGNMFATGPGIEGSISAYYYTVMRDVFVGSLCAIGVFLLWYRYERHDHTAAVLAGIFAIGVALFPTAPENPTAAQETIRTVHVGFAALFFLTLAYMSIFLFTRTYPNKTRPPSRWRDYFAPLLVTKTVPGEGLEPVKKRRNLIYRICGYTMVVCIALMGLGAIPSIGDRFEQWNPTFWLETGAVMAFGFSWLTKGEAEKMRLRFRRRGREPGKAASAPI